ncbi:E3 ubiquitin- ligase BRE1-like 2-like [Brachionus plicatilis]|uniref:E3 ubiquitin-ligase BRE1-like 2-like n=1 Tax=Brachionus plicatilis TaxID=10195 RepID=A0A3M7PU54_BRAPC|nr:E3 ubiquitin- ligase BRE1-like 2-like [Brachionus plicatilis]
MSERPSSRISSARAASAKLSARLNNKNSTEKKIDDNVLDRFIEIQAEIEKHDANGVFQGLKMAEEEFEVLEKNKRQAEINHKVLTEQTNKERQDFENISQPTVQNFFRSKQAHNQAISKEQHEYLQALNLLEISATELKSINAQYELGRQKLENYKKENQKAIELYNEQMTILYSTFDGDFGSDLENKLEKEVKQLTASKDQLRQALHKWSNARFLLVYGYNQIQTCEQKWSEMMRLDVNNPEKVIFATEVRNNLVAANQNLINTKTYLKNITLPYCTDEDLKTLQGLAAGTYQDMQTAQRQRYALNIIQVLRQRCAALYQWFDQVIKDSLVVDYSRVKIDYDQKSRELKMERIRLLQEKIKEKTGKNVTINLYDNKNDKKDNLDALLNDPFKTGGNNSGHEISEKPINSLDLPPPPSKDQILGDVEEIKKQYFQQKDDWNRHLDSSKREADEKLNEMLNKYKQAENS